MKILDHLLQFLRATAVAALRLGTVFDSSAMNRILGTNSGGYGHLFCSRPWFIQRVDFVSIHDGWVVALNLKDLGALCVTQDRGQF